MLEYVGWHDDGACLVLAIEDLSAAIWPPPWTRRQVAAVLETLEQIHGTQPPDNLPRADDPHLELREGWAEIGRNPEVFLALGLCSPGWLERHFETLLAATGRAPLAGDALLHFDVRSDNLCFRVERRSDPDRLELGVDRQPVDGPSGLLPSLNAEGGPPPDEVAPDVPPELAALVAGFFCAHASRPPLQTAPNVRGLQLRQARTALPWTARVLGLPPPA